MKYWEPIADKLKSAGWSLGWNRIVADEMFLWSADASKDGRKIIVQAEELTTAFLELERQTAEHDSDARYPPASDR